MRKRILAAALMIFIGAALTAVWADPPATQPAKELKLDIGNNVSIKLVLIPAGKFLMGSPGTEKGRQPGEGRPPGTWVNGNSQIEVTISKPFYMGITHVTVDQYAQFVKDTGQTHREPQFKQTGNHPVVMVDRNDASAFCTWLSKKTGKTVVLPTEAQWEYACRAGTQTVYYFGDDPSKLGDYAWYDHNSGGMTHPVGLKKPNVWGLYDMHGNVRQWCADFGTYRGYENANAATDPTGPKNGDFYAMRGGFFNSDSSGCRSACRGRGSIQGGIVEDGFRVVVLAAGVD